MSNILILKEIKTESEKRLRIKKINLWNFWYIWNKIQTDRIKFIALISITGSRKLKLIYINDLGLQMR